MSETGIFVFWVVLLVVMLFYPVSRWIWAMSVNRLQRKLDRDLSEEELAGQKRRAWVISTVLLFIFSFFFNAAMLGMPS